MAFFEDACCCEVKGVGKEVGSPEDEVLGVAPTLREEVGVPERVAEAVGL